MTPHTLAVVALCWCLASVAIAALWCIACEAAARAEMRRRDRLRDREFDRHADEAVGLTRDLRELSVWDAVAVVGMADFFSEWGALVDEEAGCE